MTKRDFYKSFLSELSSEAAQIAKALNETPLFNENYIATHSGGKKHGSDDRRLYQWVNVKDKKTNDIIVFITLYYNEITPDSGNFHTQFGRLQFYTGSNGLHKYVGETDGFAATKGILKIDFSNTFDPHIFIFDEDYRPSQVVKSFIDWQARD